MSTSVPFRLYLFLLALPSLVQAGDAALRFNRDIRPILSENCLFCHGQDPKHREGKLRLDERESALETRDGKAAIVPGHPEQSELMARLRSHDPEEQMPPPKSNRTVSPAQMELLQRWISEGATYEKHWAYLPPERPPFPAASNQNWAKQPLDSFVLAKLNQSQLKPSDSAKPETWLRRMSLDLTGLPPTPAELEKFTAAAETQGEAAYVAAVDEQLASPHFGERQALDWLDAARYADSHGFNNDSTRSMWRWRDWVIAAFNRNLPYDQFITEQLAGDLLPQPTLDQRIATGFSRNHGINSEGGIIDEEYRVEYVADRVRTTSTAWLGLSMECAKCHDHKFDPLTQRNYFELFAFFNNVPEHGEDGRIANAVPMIPAPTSEQQATLASQEQAIRAIDDQIAKTEITKISLSGILAAAKEKAQSLGGIALLENGADGVVGNSTLPTRDQPAATVPVAKCECKKTPGTTISAWIRPEYNNPRDVAILSAVDYTGSSADTSYGRGRELRLVDGELEWTASGRLPVYATVVRSVGAGIHAGEWHNVAVSFADGEKAAHIRLFVDAVEVPTVARYDGLGGGGDPTARPWLVGADLAKNGPRWIGEIDELMSFPKSLTAEELQANFLSAAIPLLEKSPTEPLYFKWQATAQTNPELAKQRTERWTEHLAFRRNLPTTMVMQELPKPREAHILTRGQYDLPGEAVTAGVPETLLAPWPQGAPRNRLGLARWLTQPQHPLTARVVVNRFWAQLFGTGLVKTLEDFGSQGEYPSHPELLDFLARDFIDGGWNVKSFLKSLVLSAAYRQQSEVTPALLGADPENRLLARGPRVRLPAEMIRDQALTVSGLLTRQIGGPSVFPYQPEKLYEGIVVGADYPGTKWLLSTGPDLYRRSLYTYWKRTLSHPMMSNFDAPNREFCTVRRSRTNTPLQALQLWNEPGSLEAARALATRMMREAGADDAARITFAFQLATGRKPGVKEIAVLQETLLKLKADFTQHPEDAAAFLKVGASPVDGSVSAIELAANMSIASMILCLDETITKN